MRTCLIILMTAVLLPLIAFAQPLSDRIPEDATLYIAWQGSHAMPPAFETSHLKGVLDDSNIPELFSSFLPRLAQRLERENPAFGRAMQMVNAIGAPLWRHPSALFASVDLQGPNTPPRPKIGLLCQAGPDADALFNQLNRLVATFTANTPFPIKVVKTGDLIAVLVGYEHEDQALPGSGPVKPITANPRFQQALKHVHNQPVTLLYLDTERLLNSIDQLVPRFTQPSTQANWIKARDALGLSGIKQFILTGGFDAQDWSTQAFLAVPAPRTGALSCLTGAGPLSDATLRSIPSSVAWVSACQFDLAQLLPAIRALLAAFDPQSVHVFDHALASASQALRLDLQKDLFESLGNEWAIYTDPTTSGSGAIGVSITNRLRNPTQAEQSLLKLETWANQAIADTNEEDIHLAFTQRQVHDLTIHTLSMPMFAPSWTIKNNILYIGLYPQVVVGAAKGAPSAGPSFLDNPHFLALRKRMGISNASSVTFTDLPQTAPYAYQGLLQISQLGLGIADMYGIKTPPLVMPPLNRLTRHLTPAASFTWVDDAGWHFKSLSPFPGSSLLRGDADMNMLSSSTLVSILLPALNAAQERANRIKCASNLRIISQAALLYANDHNGQYPPDLGTFITDCDVPAEVFVCPSANIDLPDEFRQLTPDKLKQAAQWADRSSSYIYLGAKMKPSDPFDRILAYDKLDNHEGEGINLLFNDGHVQWVPLPKAMELIQNQQKSQAGRL